jgi:hypothetical protein
VRIKEIMLRKFKETGMADKHFTWFKTFVHTLGFELEDIEGDKSESEDEQEKDDDFSPEE